MKKIINFILVAVAAVGFSSCKDEVTIVDTQNSFAEIIVTPDAGQKSVLVRTEGKWSVSVDEAGAEWVEFVGATSGKGEGAFTFKYAENRPTEISRGLRRKASIVVLTGDQFTSKTIELKQCGVAPTLMFHSEAIEISSEAQEVCRVSLDSNLSVADAESFRFGIVSPQGTDWLSNFGVSQDCSSITFSCTENTSGAPRVAVVSVNYVDPWGETFVSTCGVQQNVPVVEEPEDPENAGSEE